VWLVEASASADGAGISVNFDAAVWMQYECNNKRRRRRRRKRWWWQRDVDGQ